MKCIAICMQLVYSIVPVFKLRDVDLIYPLIQRNQCNLLLQWNSSRIGHRAVPEASVKFSNNKINIINFSGALTATNLEIWSLRSGL